MTCTFPPVWEQTTIAGDDTAPAAARRFVEAVVAGCPDKVVADARLLVSELASNVVRHGGRSRLTVRVAVNDGGGVRVEVASKGNQGVKFRRGRRRADRMSGWGLEIVDRLATRWGVEGGSPAVVWFELGSGQPA